MAPGLQQIARDKDLLNKYSLSEHTKSKYRRLPYLKLQRLCLDQGSLAFKFPDTDRGRKLMCQALWKIHLCNHPYESWNASELKEFARNKGGTHLGQRKKSNVIDWLEEYDATAPFRLLDLPPEVRAMIYHFYSVQRRAFRKESTPQGVLQFFLGAREPLDGSQYLRRPVSLLEPPLAMICKTVRLEYLPVFYALCEVNISAKFSNDDPLYRAPIHKLAMMRTFVVRSGYWRDTSEGVKILVAPRAHNKHLVWAESHSITENERAGRMRRRCADVAVGLVREEVKRQLEGLTTNHLTRDQIRRLGRIAKTVPLQKDLVKWYKG